MVIKDSAIYKLDLFCSDVENFLGTNAAFPVLGSVPALFRIAFGLAQFTLALTTAACSLFFCVTELGRDVFYHALRHVFHGLINILAGILQAVPILGSIICLIQYANTGPSDGPTFQNAQKNKFFGYSTIRDNTWEYYDREDITPFGKDDVPSDDPRRDVLIAAI